MLEKYRKLHPTQEQTDGYYGEAIMEDYDRWIISDELAALAIYLTRPTPTEILEFLKYYQDSTSIKRGELIAA